MPCLHDETHAFRPHHPPRCARHEYPSPPKRTPTNTPCIRARLPPCLDTNRGSITIRMRSTDLAGIATSTSCNSAPFRPAPARSIFDPAHSATLRGASVIAASPPQAPPLIPLWQRSPMLVNPPRRQRPVWHRLLRRPNGRPAVAPTSLGRVTCDGCRASSSPPFHEDLPSLRHRPRGARVREKLRLTEVGRFTLSTGRCDTPGHLHGMMRAWKKSCANQRA